MCVQTLVYNRVSNSIFIFYILLSFVSGDGRSHQDPYDVLTSGLVSLPDRHLVSTFQIHCEASWSTNEGRHVKSGGGFPRHTADSQQV